MGREKVNHRQNKSETYPENEHRYLQPTEEFKATLSPPPLTTYLEDQGKSLCPPRLPTLVSDLSPATWCYPLRWSWRGWKYHSVCGRAAYSKGGGVVSPASRAVGKASSTPLTLRPPPPARKGHHLWQMSRRDPTAGCPASVVAAGSTRLLLCWGLLQSCFDVLCRGQPAPPSPHEVGVILAGRLRKMAFRAQPGQGLSSNSPSAEPLTSAQPGSA